MWSKSVEVFNPYEALKESAEKKNEVPKEYRRNRKQEILDLLLIIASSIGIVVILMFLLIMF